ncbi:hypothetical protein HHK36_008235 [Tetracentron sinense]|uniref:BHLH domain-containing protein n=1 Tax=Tetracentron sinense TaxID=13715 RepID=A0A834ZI30_TETSI|nr:hypothetical protein HHK36_008235 [Tetracentron sinense]
MEISSTQWVSELAMEDPTFMNQWQMNSLPVEEDFQYSFSSYPTFNPETQINPTFSTDTSMENSQTCVQRPTKQFKTTSLNSCTTDHISTPEASSSPHFFSFGNPNSPENQKFHGNLASSMKPNDEVASPSDILIHQGSLGNQNYVSKAGEGAKRIGTTTRSPSHNKDHIIAERKRREKLNLRFIALSAIVPGLKKMDKASVLGDAIKYMKQLQEQVKTLKEQTMEKTVESVIVVRKSQLSANDENSSLDENSGSQSDEPLPEIEVRVSDKTVLIRIHCEQREGVLVKALSEIEKLHLTIVNTSAMPFGSSVLDITIIAQMDFEFCMTVKDLVRNLRSAFGQFM